MLPQFRDAFSHWKKLEEAAGMSLRDSTKMQGAGFC